MPPGWQLQSQQEGHSLRPTSQAQHLWRLWEQSNPQSSTCVASGAPVSPCVPEQTDLIKQKGFCTRDLPGLHGGSRGWSPTLSSSWGLSDFSGDGSEPRGGHPAVISVASPSQTTLWRLILSVTSQISLLAQSGAGHEHLQLQVPPRQSMAPHCSQPPQPSSLTPPP